LPTRRKRLKAALIEDMQQQQASADRDHAPAEGVPATPAPDAQSLLGPDIAKTR
jgi:hypothetical protein